MLPEITFAFPAPVWDELVARLELEEESAGVLLAGAADGPGGRLTYAVNHIKWVPDDLYRVRTSELLDIPSAAWMPALKAADREGLQPVFFHTHPNNKARPSQRDAEVDRALAKPFQIRGSTPRYASFILGGTRAAPTYTGQVTDTHGTRIAISRVRIAGASRLRMLSAEDAGLKTASDLALHDRQVRAFGAAGQNVLGNLRVGVVGAGGTGSSTIEQLARLGVGEITVIDDDHVSETNISRVYGSRISDVGRPKVDVARDNVEGIGLGTKVVPINARIDSRAALEQLRHCDVVFGCTDDHTGRMNLSRLAFYYLIPVIDIGVAIHSVGGIVRSIAARVTFVAPGEPCLVCRGVVDPAMVREEAYSEEQRAALAGENYARGLGEPDPSVIAYTTMVSSWGVADLFERLFGFGDEAVAGELLLRVADRKMKGRSRPPRETHLCGDQTKWGLGDQDAFLGQKVWTK